MSSEKLEQRLSVFLLAVLHLLARLLSDLRAWRSIYKSVIAPRIAALLRGAAAHFKTLKLGFIQDMRPLTGLGFRALGFRGLGFRVYRV